MTGLGWLLQREVIVTLAIVGALIATVGSAMTGRAGVQGAALCRHVVRVGYAITFASMALFIIAGFLSDR
jgi:hypothetical protein